MKSLATMLGAPVLALLLLAVLSSAKIHRRVVPALHPGSVPNRRALTVTPLNTAIRLGDTVELACEVADYRVSRVYWFEFVTTAVGQMLSDNGNILQSHPNAARYRMIRNNVNEFRLEIHDVQLEDGGSYICLDGYSGAPEIYSGQAELVVIVAEPNCTSIIPEGGAVIEGQNYTAECQVYYGGNMAPSMNWAGPPPFYTTTIPNKNDVYSGLLFTVNQAMDTRAYRCTTNFTAPLGVPEGVADNAPEYEHVYQSRQLFVYWGPRNIYAEPIKPIYEVGDQVTCYADAFPPAFYEWTNMRTLVTISSQMFTVTADMVGFNTSMRCQARNLVQEFVFSANLFIDVNVPAPTTPTTPPTTMSTTTPPLDSPCFNLTGWWKCDNPYAELLLLVATGPSARVTGFMRNYTDQQWVEAVGRTRLPDYRYLGLSLIWPYEIGVTGLSVECHRCSGVEVMIVDSGWRSSYDSTECGDGGTPDPHTSYRFYRVGIIDPQMFESPDFKVYKPTNEVSGQFGVRF